MVPHACPSNDWYLSFYIQYAEVNSRVVATDDGSLEEKQESESSFYKGYILQNMNLKILLTLIIK